MSEGNVLPVPLGDQPSRFVHRWLSDIGSLPKSPRPNAVLYMRRYYRENPLKVKARRAVGTEIRAGRMKKQPCEDCGKAKAEAHHDDYEKPLDVRWLCRGCHSKRHPQKRTSSASASAAGGRR